jgi:AcrR family transcriptional regulator
MTRSLSIQVTRRELNPRQAETVERVAEAARQELRTVGFDGLTVRSVAGRAGVAPATAYTYFSSKNHLIAEIFWRQLRTRPKKESRLGTPLKRVIAVFEDLSEFLCAEPELAAATTTALLGSEPDVKALRVLVGVEINDRLSAALGEHPDAGVLDALSLAWSGAMVQAGMGHSTYEQLGRRLVAAARLIMRGVR